MFEGKQPDTKLQHSQNKKKSMHYIDRGEATNKKDNAQ